MFLNVIMVLLPPRGYRQGCHRSPLRTALPIVIGIVPGSHPYIFYCLFWTFFNGPSLLNLWPFSIGPHLNINVSLIGLQCWGHGLRHDFPSPGAALVHLDVHLLAVFPPVSPYILKGQGGSPFPPCTSVLREVCLLTALAFFLFSRSPFSVGALLAEDRPYLLRTVVMVPPPH